MRTHTLAQSTLTHTLTRTDRETAWTSNKTGLSTNRVEIGSFNSISSIAEPTTVATLCLTVSASAATTYITTTICHHFFFFCWYCPTLPGSALASVLVFAFCFFAQKLIDNQLRGFSYAHGRRRSCLLRSSPSSSSLRCCFALSLSPWPPCRLVLFCLPAVWICCYMIRFNLFARSVPGHKNILRRLCCCCTEARLRQPPSRSCHKLFSCCLALLLRCHCFLSCRIKRFK